MYYNPQLGLEKLLLFWLLVVLIYKKDINKLVKEKEFFISPNHILNWVKFKNNWKKRVIVLICWCLDQNKIFALIKKLKNSLKISKAIIILIGIINVNKPSNKKNKKLNWSKMTIKTKIMQKIYHVLIMKIMILIGKTQFLTG